MVTHDPVRDAVAQHVVGNVHACGVDKAAHNRAGPIQLGDHPELVAV